MRYFFISFSWSDGKSFGFRNCTFKSEKYPSIKDIVGIVSGDNENIVIINILELNESDFKDLTNKD